LVFVFFFQKPRRCFYWLIISRGEKFKLSTKFVESVPIVIALRTRTYACRKTSQSFFETSAEKIFETRGRARALSAHSERSSDPLISGAGRLEETRNSAKISLFGWIMSQKCL